MADITYTLSSKVLSRLEFEFCLLTDDALNLYCRSTPFESQVTGHGFLHSLWAAVTKYLK